MNSRLANNYGRPGGQQNVGNFLTDKPSSRVLAPPGGGSQIVFGDYQEPVAAQRTAAPPHAQYSSNHDHDQPPAGSRPVVTAATQYGSGYQQPPPQPYGGELQQCSYQKPLPLPFERESHFIDVHCGLKYIHSGRLKANDVPVYLVLHTRQIVCWCTKSLLSN
jgi:hypothetical protein